MPADVHKPCGIDGLPTYFEHHDDQCRNGARHILPPRLGISVLDGEIEKTIDRNFIFRAQTPQGFPYSKILEAHEGQSNQHAFDDVELANKFGLKVILKTGHRDNMKITTPEHFLEMSKILVKNFGREIKKKVLDK